jgi:hypothetical protein
MDVEKGEEKAELKWPEQLWNWKPSDGKDLSTQANETSSELKKKLDELENLLSKSALALIPMEGKPANKSGCNRSRSSVESSCSATRLVIGYQEP